ncbi:MAG: hypothetical protein IKP40_04440 [Clostridia bacterium]|nr:hypothetical protein [Clostridia bacterium]
MADLCRARVCAVGPDTAMCKLLRVMLLNFGVEPENAPGEQDLSGWQALMQDVCLANDVEEGSFLYEMIAEDAYGDADPASCRLIMKRQGCGLWTALFSYEGETPFQGHDWLMLHRRSGFVLMSAIYAQDFPGAPRGGMIFTGGKLMDEWSRMDAAWLWLMTDFGADEGLCEKDEMLTKLLGEREENEDDEVLDGGLRFGLLDALLGFSGDEDEEDEEAEDGDEEDGEEPDPGLALLSDTAAFLRDTASRTADQQALKEEMQAALASRDFPALLDAQLALADAELWETDRAEEWVSRLRELG